MSAIGGILDVSDRLAGLDCCYSELPNMMGVRAAARLMEGAEVAGSKLPGKHATPNCCFNRQRSISREPDILSGLSLFAL